MGITHRVAPLRAFLLRVGLVLYAVWLAAVVALVASRTGTVNPRTGWRGPARTPARRRR